MAEHHAKALEGFHYVGKIKRDDRRFSVFHCDQCGALTVNQAGHEDWHKRGLQTGRLSADT